MAECDKAELVDKLYATDFILHDAASPGVLGLEGVKQNVSRNRAAFPDLHYAIEDMIAEGDKVVTRYTITATHQGELMGIPPTGEQGTVTGITIHRIADGKIMEGWSNWDALGMMQQMGVIPPDREDFTWGEPSEVTGDPGDPETNKNIVPRVRELWNTGNLTIADEIFATDFVRHVAGNPDVHGPEGFKQSITVVRIEWPDFHVTMEDMVAEGDKAVSRYTVTGTHEGGAYGIPKTGKRMTWKGINIWRFANGKIVENWESGDVLGIWQQLGLTPPMVKD